MILTNTHTYGSYIHIVFTHIWFGTHTYTHTILTHTHMVMTHTHMVLTRTHTHTHTRMILTYMVFNTH
jgi:hypothetical protein